MIPHEKLFRVYRLLEEDIGGVKIMHIVQEPILFFVFSFSFHLTSYIRLSLYSSFSEMKLPN